jgi:hypothetical protein
MVAANPFEGMVTENPYRHKRDFTTICNMVRQEGVPDEWFKWNLFPYSLARNAKTWYSVASFEVEGNWNKLIKKFCEKFFCNTLKFENFRMLIGKIINQRFLIILKFPQQLFSFQEI